MPEDDSDNEIVTLQALHPHEDYTAGDGTVVPLDGIEVTEKQAKVLIAEAAQEGVTLTRRG